MFPDPLLSSSQYAALCASIPSLALISEQDSPGSLGMEPRGTKQNIICSELFGYTRNRRGSSAGFNINIVNGEREVMTSQTCHWTILTLCLLS